MISSRFSIDEEDFISFPDDATLFQLNLDLDGPLSMLLNDYLHRSRIVDDDENTPVESLKSTLKREAESLIQFTQLSQILTENSQRSLDNAKKVINEKDTKKYITDDQRNYIQELDDVSTLVNDKLVEINDLLQKKQSILTSVSDSASLGQFKAKWEPIMRETGRKRVSTKEQNNCIICLERIADAVLVRNCSEKHGKCCEKRPCQCGPIVCKECLIHNFWVQSKRGKKSYANCVHCRAEYCMRDIILVKFRDTEEIKSDKKHKTKSNHQDKYNEKGKQPSHKTKSDHKERKPTLRRSHKSLSQSNIISPRHHHQDDSLAS